MANTEIKVGYKICFWVLPILWVQTLFFKAWIWAARGENIEIELVQRIYQTNQSKSRISFLVWFIWVKLRKVE